jgi:hypothetical protein
MSLHWTEAVHVDECYRHEIRDGSSKVALANRNDPIEALLVNRSHEAFRVRIRIRRPERGLYDSKAGIV